MADPWGFIKIQRELPSKRPVHERIQDWKEIYLSPPVSAVRSQAARCMDCGIPFCHAGCPLGNDIPTWNDLAYRDNWREAIDRLHATNNFPEFTGKLCPAPCEAACVLGINADPVTIKQVELSIIEHAFDNGWINPQPPALRTGKRIAIVGSGPAGLAAAQQLNRAGHWVTVFERDNRIGGLIRYGIPDFKMDKNLLDRRLSLLEAEGITFQTNANIGVNVPVEDLLSDFDAITLTTGATKPRDVLVPGRELRGVHFAMEYLTQQNRRNAGEQVPEHESINAQGKHVVILGGGDTGDDCLGTAHRQGAASVTQLQRWPQPPSLRNDDNPWPEWPTIFRVSAAHEEGGTREFAVVTKAFQGQAGQVSAVQAVRSQVIRDGEGRGRLEEIPGTEFDIPADLVLLAVGYAGPEPDGVVSQLGLGLTTRGTIATDRERMTSREGIFAAGDAAYGQSLIVWAIAEGRQVARSIDQYLMGTTVLPY